MTGWLGLETGQSTNKKLARSGDRPELPTKRQERGASSISHPLLLRNYQLSMWIIECR